MTTDLRSIDDVLSAFTPRTEAEAADVVRTRALSGLGDVFSRTTPLHVTVSALIVHPPTGRVLLRWHDRQQAWLQVGGHGDPGEIDPLAIVLREAREETGLDDLAPWPTAEVVHVVIVPVAPGKGEPAHEHADVRFVLATQRPEAARPEHPGAELRWLSLPDALELVGTDNLRETLTRLEALLLRS